MNKAIITIIGIAILMLSLSGGIDTVCDPYGVMGYVTLDGIGVNNVLVNVTVERTGASILFITRPDGYYSVNLMDHCQFQDGDTIKVETNISEYRNFFVGCSHWGDSAICSVDRGHSHTQIDLDYDYRYTMPLQEGWNLVGYLSIKPTQPVEEALSSIDGNYTKVSGWVDGWGLHYIPGFPFNTLENMSEGYGYWIKMNASDVLEWN